MSKDVIHVNGEDVVVREDIAKAFRGANWALISVAGFVLIAGILFVAFFFGAARDGSIESPDQRQSANSR